MREKVWMIEFFSSQVFRITFNLNLNTFSGGLLDIHMWFVFKQELDNRVDNFEKENQKIQVSIYNLPQIQQKQKCVRSYIKNSVSCVHDVIDKVQN